MQIILILSIPVLLAAAALLFKREKAFGIANAAGYGIVLSAGASLLLSICSSGVIFCAGFIRVDFLSAFFIFTTSVIAFATALYSIGYIERSLRSGIMPQRKVKTYYLLFNLFSLSMFIVPAVNNLGMLWVAIEMTTLISAFLVGFYRSKESVEAAWKYIIICSVGIIFALLGTILVAYAFMYSGGAKSLDWSEITASAAMMDKNMLKIAFIFILIGYGTKAGLAPMHTWLPDAHSQAVAPISALLSGVLLKTAIYAILRFGIIVARGAGFGYFGNLMLLFGIISLIISSAFILVQKDLKRLLAYSSIEHVGIISIGFGLGTPLAIAGALAHIFNHAVNKSLMFFGAGNIADAYKEHNMHSIRGVIAAMPFTGIVTLIGMFALVGLPPFSVFAGEIMIIMAAFMKSSYVVAAIVLVFLSVIFGSFVHHFGQMLFGNLPKGMEKRGEPLSMKLSFLFLFFQVCTVSIFIFLLRKELLWIAAGLF